jgi:hypothetical protein
MLTVEKSEGNVKAEKHRLSFIFCTRSQTIYRQLQSLGEQTDPNRFCIRIEFGDRTGLALVTAA